jgi:predicted amidophosphoribosyltransferase
VGKIKLAQLLQGSKAKAMRQFGYDRSRYYGRLAVFRQSEIKMMIEQLTDQGYLKAVGGHGPVLRLTPQGEISVRNKASIQLELPREISSKRIALKKAERAAGGTVRLTKQMLRQGLEPAWIASERGLTENTIYGHLAHLIENSKISLSTVMTDVDISKITEAAAQAGSTSTLSEIKMFLPESISYGQIRCVLASLKKSEFTSVDKGISSFLSGPHPFALKGPWDIGWALDYHSRYVGATWERGELGQLLYRLKYKQDKSVLSDLAAQLSAFAKGRPPLMEVEAIVPVPSTSQRGIDPVSSLARALGAELKRPVWPILTKTRRNKPQKEMRTLIQKQENVAGVFKVTEPVQGKRLLVIDDLHDSGATLAEVSRTLRRGGAVYIAVLTMTRTIHTDR